MIKKTLRARSHPFSYSVTPPAVPWAGREVGGVAFGGGTVTISWELQHLQPAQLCLEGVSLFETSALKPV